MQKSTRVFRPERGLSPSEKLSTTRRPFVLFTGDVYARIKREKKKGRIGVKVKRFRSECEMKESEDISSSIL